jgi:hypothetical protein
VLLGLVGVIHTHHLSVAFKPRLYLVVGVEDVRLEEGGDLSDVARLQLLAVAVSVDFEVEVQEIFCGVLLVHADVLELELCDDVVVGEEGTELDKLIPEIFNELVVDIADPGLQLDGHVLEHEMDALLLLQHLVDSYHMLVLQLTKQAHLLVHPGVVRQTHVVDLAHQHPHHRGGDLFALPEGVVLLHRDYHLLWHATGVIAIMGIIGLSTHLHLE